MRLQFDEGPALVFRITDAFDPTRLDKQVDVAERRAQRDLGRSTGTRRCDPLTFQACHCKVEQNPPGRFVQQAFRHEIDAVLTTLDKPRSQFLQIGEGRIASRET